MIVTEPTTPLIFHAQPGGTFLFMGCFMYQFDQELSALVFPMISKIEVALRVRLVEALLIHNRYRKFIFYLGVKLSV